MAATTQNYTTSITINGVNNFSRPIGVGVDRSINSLERLSARARGISIAALRTGQTFSVFAAGLAAPLIYAGKQAVMFEDKMADVSKVTNTPVGSAGFKKMSEEVKGLSVYLGTSATEAADLFTTLAQGGTKVGDLEAIAKIAGQTSVAFGVTEEEAGKAFSRIQNVMDYTITATGLVGDAINVLSNTRNATAGEILTFLNSGGIGAAKMFGMSATDAAAFGATLRATVTPSAEEAATVMERFGKAVVQSKSLRKIFEANGRGAKGFVAIMKKGLASKDPQNFFLNMGMYGNQIRALADGMEGPKGLSNALRAVSDEGLYAGSVFGEFSNKQSTMLSFLKREWAGVQNAIINFGDATLPILKDVVNDLKPMVAGFGAWIKEHPDATRSIAKITAEIAAFSTAVAGLSFAVSGIFTTISAWAGIKIFFKRAFFAEAAEGLAMWAESMSLATLQGTLFTSSQLGVAGAWIALGAAAVYAFDKIAPFRDAVIQTFEGFAALDRHSWEWLDALVHLDFARIGRINAAIDLEAKINSGASIQNYQKEAAVKTGTDRRSMEQGNSRLSRFMVPNGQILPKSMQADTTTSFLFNPTYNINTGVPGQTNSQILDDLSKRTQYDFEMMQKKIAADKQRRALR